MIWQGERLSFSTILLLLTTILIAGAAAMIPLFDGPDEPVAGTLVLSALLAGLMLAALVAAAAHARAELVITDLRAWLRSGWLRRRAEVPIADLTSLVITRRVWQLPLQLVDLTIRTAREESLLFPSVTNADAAIAALGRLVRVRGRALQRIESDDGSIMFIPVAAEPDLETPATSEGEPPPGGSHPGDAGRRWAHPALVISLTLVAVTGVGFLALARMRSVVVLYPPADSIYPAGEKRSQREIIAFMESEVMPFARKALGPVVGGAEKVRCETCHGEDAEVRGWRMPAVRALPEPHVLEQITAAGGERDPFVNTAIYGYLASSEKQETMKRMRDVVVPGMAELLGRPGWDFTRSYEHNRQRFAFGCYHCHRAE